MNANFSKKIAVAPTHYILSSKDTGSEFSWANNFFFRIQNHPDAKHLGFKFTTGGASEELSDRKNIINLNIFNPEKIDLSIKNLALFYIKLHASLFKQYFSKEFDVYHHFLPFHIDRSFNLLAPIAKSFIVGPIQSKLEVLDTDLSVNDVRGFKGENKLNKAIYATIISILQPIVNVLNLLTLKSAKKIIVINRHTKDYLLKRGIKEDRVVIIPPGIETGKFAAIAKPRIIKDTVRILLVGYMLNRKRMNLAIETVKLLVEKYNIRNIKLTIAGDGPQREALNKLVKDHNLNDYIEFAGFIPNSEINKYYAESDIFLNFSQAEGFATVCLEALASGLVIISTPVGGFIDSIENSISGFILSDTDLPDEAARIIKNIINDPNMATKISSKAIETSKNYDWDGAIIPQYIGIYGQL